MWFNLIHLPPKRSGPLDLDKRLCVKVMPSFAAGSYEVTLESWHVLPALAKFFLMSNRFGDVLRE